MNLDQFKPDDVAEMKAIERAVIKALMPFREKTDPLLAVVALTRCLRVMIRLGDAEAQSKLLPVLEGYLHGRTPILSSPLWTPGRN
jgi:hypothetical protein